MAQAGEIMTREAFDQFLITMDKQQMAKRDPDTVMRFVLQINRGREIRAIWISNTTRKDVALSDGMTSTDPAP